MKRPERTASTPFVRSGILKRFLFGGIASVAVLGGILGFRTALFRSRQLSVPPAPAVEVDADAAARRLAGAIRHPTISFEDPAAFDPGPFAALHRYLAESFPRVHAELVRETIGGASLLYTWQGSRSELPPMLLLAHLDVVPVEPGTESSWTVPPFEGRIHEGHVWGRGAIDDKASVLAILEAAEALLARGFRPERTILLAFGHDEEIGGRSGAARIAEVLQSRGIRPELVLDEGGLVAEGIVASLRRPVAFVGIAEKGYLNLELSVEAEGGHSSRPPSETAIGILARAIRRLEETPFPPRISGPTAKTLEFLGPEMPWANRLALANLWLFGPAVRRALASEPSTNATIRTTLAATIFQAGVKANVLPRKARAVVNLRILPGDTVEGVTAAVERRISDPRVRVTPLGEDIDEPSPVSSPDTPVFGALQRTIAEIFPEAVVAPYLTIGATDSRHYARLSPNVFRFLPLRLRREDLVRIHGRDERIAIANYVEMIRFYGRLIEWARAPGNNSAGRPTPLEGGFGP